VRPGGCDAKAVRLGAVVSRLPELAQRSQRFLRPRADVGCELDHRGEQLHLQDAGQRPPLRRGHERLDARRERERVGVEDQHLLLDPQGPGRAAAEGLLDHGAVR